jgi:hypothetical protein
VHISAIDPATIVQCENGHRCWLYITDGGFSLLYQRGLQRLATGALRDAVIDAHTALEMFLAHVPVRAIYDRTLGAKPSEIRKDLNGAQLLDSFERTFGAALGMSALVSGASPVRVDFKKTRKIRNDAVHMGIEPSVEKAEALCLEVERIMREILRQLDTQPCGNSQSYFDADWNEQVAAVKARVNLEGVSDSLGASLGTLFGINFKTTRTASDYIADYREAHREGDDAWPVW